MSLSLVKTITITMIAGSLLIPQGALAASANDIVGKWATPNNKSRIQIFKKGSKYFGKIIWLKVPKRKGKAKLDMKNPSAKLKKRPIMGLTLLNSFSYKGGEWVGGTIYNPEDGKTYSCKMNLKSNKVLKVRGYVFNPILGKTQTWRRAR